MIQIKTLALIPSMRKKRTERAAVFLICWRIGCISFGEYPIRISPTTLFFKEKDFADRPTISLGVHDRLHSTLPYYIKRRNLSWLELQTVPPYSGCEFYFIDEARDSARRILPQMILIKTYPFSGNHLVKTKQEP